MFGARRHQQVPGAEQLEVAVVAIGPGDAGRAVPAHAGRGDGLDLIRVVVVRDHEDRHDAVGAALVGDSRVHRQRKEPGLRDGRAGPSRPAQAASSSPPTPARAFTRRPGDSRPAVGRQRGSTLIDLLRTTSPMMASTSTRESLLPGRRSADGRQGPDRQPHQQRVERDQADARRPARCSASVYSVAARRSSRASAITSSSCAARDVDAPFALVDVGVLEDVDQLQRLAEQPRARAQGVGGGRQPRAIEQEQLRQHLTDDPRDDVAVVAQLGDRTEPKHAVGARTARRPSIIPSADRLTCARRMCAAALRQRVQAGRARTGSRAAARGSPRGRRADRRAALGEAARLRRIGALQQRHEVVDAPRCAVGGPARRVLEGVDDAEQQVGEADLFARRRRQLSES